MAWKERGLIARNLTAKFEHEDESDEQSGYEEDEDYDIVVDVAINMEDGGDDIAIDEAINIEDGGDDISIDIEEEGDEGTVPEDINVDEEGDEGIVPEGVNVDEEGDEASQASQFKQASQSQEPNSSQPLQAYEQRKIRFKSPAKRKAFLAKFQPWRY
ncbi:hypothetical protein GBA52_020483 [Prunus armeniaca]|nr:hypothetical protein GBA52_020483 [Prunus armeniaca]